MVNNIIRIKGGSQETRRMGGRDSISKGDVDDQIDNGKTGS